MLVPDELTTNLLVDRIKDADCENGYVLDGFPRTIPQAECLDRALEGLGEKIDFAVNVEVPDENIIRRMSGRRACLSCGATYHIQYNPPKQKMFVMRAAVSWYSEMTIKQKRSRNVWMSTMLRRSL